MVALCRPTVPSPQTFNSAIHRGSWTSFVVHMPADDLTSDVHLQLPQNRLNGCYTTAQADKKIGQNI